MKQPNGFGTVVKCKDGRRKPWRAVKTIGYDLEDGKQKRYTVGYFKTRLEALTALSNFKYDPQELEYNKITLKEVYERWSEHHFKKISIKTITMYKTSFNHLKPLYKKQFKEIKALHLQELFDGMSIAESSKRTVKSLLNSLYRYAMKYEIVDKDYSKLITLGRKEKILERKIFTEEEIAKLWKYKELEWVDTILIMIYTGMRIGELLGLKNEHIDFENRIIKGAGIKTEAGKNRVIPINKKILPFIQNRMRASNGYLFFNRNDTPYHYNHYRLFFKDIMDKLEMTHTIHDCRHTFATLLNNAEANPTTIKNIIGHSSFETTEKIYTHKDIEELKKAIDLI